MILYLEYRTVSEKFSEVFMVHAHIFYYFSIYWSDTSLCYSSMNTENIRSVHSLYGIYFLYFLSFSVL